MRVETSLCDYGSALKANVDHWRRGVRWRGRREWWMIWAARLGVEIMLSGPYK